MRHQAMRQLQDLPTMEGLRDEVRRLRLMVVTLGVLVVVSLLGAWAPAALGAATDAAPAPVRAAEDGLTD